MQAVKTNQPTLTIQQQPSSDGQTGAINEMILSGPPWQAGHFLKPMISELADTHKARWLTLIVHDKEAPATIHWLKSSGINSNRVQVLNASSRETARLTCQALASGTSHTVISWLEQMDIFTLKKLESAAKDGRCQGLAIRSRLQ